MGFKPIGNTCTKNYRRDTNGPTLPFAKANFAAAQLSHCRHPPQCRNLKAGLELTTSFAKANRELLPELQHLQHNGLIRIKGGFC